MENITFKLQKEVKSPLYQQLYHYIIGEMHPPGHVCAALSVGTAVCFVVPDEPRLIGPVVPQHFIALPLKIAEVHLPEARLRLKGHSRWSRSEARAAIACSRKTVMAGA